MIKHLWEVAYELSIGTKIGDLEWRNGRYRASFGSFLGRLRKI